LNALVENARVSTPTAHLAGNDDDLSLPDAVVSERRRYALRTLARLASDATNRARMVNHDGLVKTLIQFASSSPESETKDQVKKTILLLVKEL